MKTFKSMILNAQHPYKEKTRAKCNKLLTEADKTCNKQKNRNSSVMSGKERQAGHNIMSIKQKT